MRSPKVAPAAKRSKPKGVSSATSEPLASMRATSLPTHGHLEAVAGVGDHVDVGQYPVEDRHVVGGEGADTAVAALAKLPRAALEPPQSAGPAPR